MINEKIDHHFNELSPADFNIFGDASLYEKLIKEKLHRDKAIALLDHITVIKEQVESVVNQEDEHLAVVYNFLSEQELSDYLHFLKTLETEVNKYLNDQTH